MIKRIDINPYGGLANRMRAIAAGISMAKEMNISYRVIWCLDKGLKARFDDIFVIPKELIGSIRHINLFSYALLYCSPLLKNLYITNLTLKRYCSVCDEMNGRIEIKGKGVALVKGCGDFYPYTPEFYRSLFKLQPNLQNKIDDIKSKLGEKLYWCTYSAD